MKKRDRYLSKISKKLDSIDKKISKIQKEEDKIEKDEEKMEGRLSRIEKEEQQIEKVVMRFGKLSLKRRQVYELIRASAGAFLGVGLGRGLLGLDGVAKNLAWLNIFGILLFILAISAILIYKDEKSSPREIRAKYIIRRLFFIYSISIIIELISLLLFNVQYSSGQELVKILIVGSYTAMASAVTFSMGK
jgi:hypothetical protein